MKKTIFITIFVFMLALGLVSADLNVNPASTTVNFANLEQEKTFNFEIENNWINDTMDISISIEDLYGLNQNFFDFDWTNNEILENKTKETVKLTMDANLVKNLALLENDFDEEIKIEIYYENPDNTSMNGTEEISLNLFLPKFERKLDPSSTKIDVKDFNPGDSFEKTITLKNEGTVTVDGISYEIDEDFKDKYDLEITLPENIAPGNSINLKVEGTIPDELQIDASDKETLTIKANNIDDIKIDVEISSKIMVIDRVEIRADGRRLERILREDYLSSTIPYRVREDAKLGDEIELIVYIRNNLPSDDRDNELRNIDIELYSFDIIDADGLEGYISRIRPGRTEDVTLSFYLDPRDLFAGDAPYDLEIRVSGEDWDRNLFEDTWFIDIDIETLTYNLLMHNIMKSPDPVCAGERLRIEFDLFNIGTRDLDDAAIAFRSTNLDINEFIQDIEIYDDERQFITKFLDIPSNAQEGDYTLQIIAYPRRTSTRDTTTQNILISVRDCDPETTTTTTVPETTTTTVPETTTTTLRQIIGSDAGVIPAEPRKDNEQLYIILLIVLIGLVILAVGGMIGYLIKKK